MKEKYTAENAKKEGMGALINEEINYEIKVFKCDDLMEREDYNRCL